MNVDILADRKGLFACLVNCRIEEDAIFCAIASFRGGISGVIEVENKDGIKRKIIIPASVRRSATFVTFTSLERNYKLAIA